MGSVKKDEDSDNRESLGLKISELLKALAERKSSPCDTTQTDSRNISATLSILKARHGTIRSRAFLPENIILLSKCEFKRWDPLSESLPATVPVPSHSNAETTVPERQLQQNISPSIPVVLSHLMEKSKTPPSESTFSFGELLKKKEIYPHILGVHAWTKQHSCEPQGMPHKLSLQTGPTSEWFFEDLMDLQRKLFLGGAKKYGIPKHSHMSGKNGCHNSPEPTS
ncbi:uncharacterized protein LOC117152690 [Mastacembelus armatus]|uniref:uncharacterized protein LOC117152690 n=1 Tax=Mastacembelus armatus TaxID=205130 RepID=UPI001436CC17|nr:uncharacterized protein LOC117152690 [Mastacembelus armatus]